MFSDCLWAHAYRCIRFPLFVMVTQYHRNFPKLMCSSHPKRRSPGAWNRRGFSQCLQNDLMTRFQCHCLCVLYLSTTLLLKKKKKANISVYPWEPGVISNSLQIGNSGLQSGEGVLPVSICPLGQTHHGKCVCMALVPFPPATLPCWAVLGLVVSEALSPWVPFHPVMRKKHQLSLEDVCDVWPGQIPAAIDTSTSFINMGRHLRSAGRTNVIHS